MARTAPRSRRSRAVWWTGWVLVAAGAALLGYVGWQYHGTDLVSTFLHELAEGAGITLHVRLIGGDDPQHVLQAIFKALGVAIAQACRPQQRKE